VRGDEVRDRVAAELLATAATSLRSTSASAGSPDSRSAERSGRIRVGNGFMAARTTIASPFETPPSMPPAWLVSR
jgi:hypothetical protein